MDPRKQECFGYFLYGAGFFSRDENTLRILTGRATSRPHFCLSCPKRVECEDAHEQRVRDLQPAEAGEFDRRMAQAVERGIPPTLAAAFLGKRGVDPYMTSALGNFSRGHADRGRESGPLVQ